MPRYEWTGGPNILGALDPGVQVSGGSNYTPTPVWPMDTGYHRSRAGTGPGTGRIDHIRATRIAPGPWPMAGPPAPKQRCMCMLRFILL